MMDNNAIIKGRGETGTVTIDGELLSPSRSLMVVGHSPTGFSWGYGGSGPSQLACAILLAVTDDTDIARRYHQPFKWDHVAHWRNGGDFMITAGEIKRWVEKAIRDKR